MLRLKQLRRVQLVSDHGSEIFLLWTIAVGLLGYMAFANVHGEKIDLAACLVVLTSIISAIKERWTQRTVDRMGVSLANAPAADPAAIDPNAAKVEG